MRAPLVSFTEESERHIRAQWTTALRCVAARVDLVERCG
jgi:hypothetical protein